MSTGLAIAFGILTAAVVVLVVVLAAGERRRAPRRAPYSTRSSATERERAVEAQAEIEDHDIDEMVEALDRLRRRTGTGSIGDELADEARRPPDERA